MINIRHYASTLIHWIKKCQVVRSWSKDAIAIRSQIKPHAYQHINQLERILILAPHSDDEWIGCSRLMKNYPNTVICSMEMEGGDNKQKHAERIAEMQKVAGLHDCRLETIQSNKVQSLIELIHRFKPYYICVPCIFDWHPEHIQVITYLKEALIHSDYNCEVLSYQITVPMPIEMCKIVIPLSSSDQIEKWKIFSAYYNTQSFMPIKRFMKQEEINGAICKSFAAEVFYNLPAKEWVKHVSDYHLDNEEQELVKRSFNRIRPIREVVETIYHKKFSHLNHED